MNNKLFYFVLSLLCAATAMLGCSTDNSHAERRDPSTETQDTDSSAVSDSSDSDSNSGGDLPSDSSTQSDDTATQSVTSDTETDTTSGSLDDTTESASDTGTGEEPPEYGIPGQSCVGLGDICLDGSCCEFESLSGGSLAMGEDGGETSEGPEHEVTIAPFHMETFEVVVGRFRKFVEAYDGVTFPAAGQGAHPLIPGTGWDTDWNALMPSSRAALITLVTQWDCHYTSMAGGGAMEAKPMNCVPWYLAEAFCIWDGARLPTEAEWEFAAAGGEEDRRFPWGNDEPADGDRCNYAIVSGCNSGLVTDVGSAPLGISRYGMYDMAGSVAEWTLDWYAMDFYDTCDTPPCSNPVNLSHGDLEYKTTRGGSSANVAMSQNRTSARGSAKPENNQNSSLGLRCVR